MTKRKVPLEDYEKIKTLYNHGYSKDYLAKKYNVTRTLINRILRTKGRFYNENGISVNS